MTENQTQTNEGAAMEVACVSCRKRPPAPGRRSCDECLTEMSELQQQRREKRRKNQECPDCGFRLETSEIEAGFTRCSVHRQASHGRVRNAREQKKELEQRHGIH